MQNYEVGFFVLLSRYKGCIVLCRNWSLCVKKRMCCPLCRRVIFYGLGHVGVWTGRPSPPCPRGLFGLDRIYSRAPPLTWHILGEEVSYWIRHCGKSFFIDLKYVWKWSISLGYSPQFHCPIYPRASYSHRTAEAVLHNYTVFDIVQVMCLRTSR